MKELTSKQLKTLLLFSQNYSLKTIARKQKVSVSTVRQRIRTLSSLFPNEFENALGLRYAYKRSEYNIKHPLKLDEIVI